MEWLTVLRQVWEKFSKEKKIFEEKSACLDSPTLGDRNLLAELILHRVAGPGQLRLTSGIYHEQNLILRFRCYWRHLSYAMKIHFKAENPEKIKTKWKVRNASSRVISFRNPLRWTWAVFLCIIAWPVRNWWKWGIAGCWVWLVTVVWWLVISCQALTYRCYLSPLLFPENFGKWNITERSLVSYIQDWKICT